MTTDTETDGPALDALISAAEAAMGRGDLDGAEVALASAAAQAPEAPLVCFHQGTLALQRGRPSEAAEHYQTVSRQAPGAAAVHGNLALALRRAGNPGAAEAAARRAALLDPAGAGAWSTIALAGAALERQHRRCTRPPEDYARLAVALEPANAGRRGELGFVLWRSGKHAEAEVILRDLVDSGQAGPTDRLNLGNVLAALGRSAEAAALYRAATADPRTEADAYHNLALSHLEAGNVPEAAEAFARLARRRHGRPAQDDPRFADVGQPGPADPPSSRLAARHRLHHDAEQFGWLAERGLLPEATAGIAAEYQDVLDSLTPEKRDAISFDLTAEEHARLAPAWNRLVHVAGTGWGDGPALDPSLDWAGMEDFYLSGTPRHAVVDDLLLPDALEALRQFCLGSTIWFEIKGAGYLGAYFRSGFNDPLLVRIAQDMQRLMPRVVGPHKLKTMWGYKYEQGMVGINPHADFAAVNVNFWVTPDEANLDPTSGGLVVYPKLPPTDWSFEQYNSASIDSVYAYLGETKAQAVRVPHRSNRALLFDSRLFHETDRIDFAPGYENRRINITMLFGEGP